MATEPELASMAYQAYRPAPNNSLIPPGWTFMEDLSPPDRGNGYDASVFRSDGGDIVVSFRGTDFDTLSDMVNANLPCAFGYFSSRPRTPIRTLADVAGAEGDG